MKCKMKTKTHKNIKNGKINKRKNGTTTKTKQNTKTRNQTKK